MIATTHMGGDLGFVRRATKRQRQQSGSGSQQIQVAGDLINTFAGVRITTVPALLPRDVPGFVGREEELAGLGGLAEDRSLTKVALISGPAGVGKTALTVHSAHLLQSQFSDGQLYADMHGYTDGHEPAEPGDVLVGFLQQLGVENAEMPATVEGQSGLLRNLLASKRVLMLLDNVANEAQIRPLLPGAGSSLTVISSRSPLMALDVDQRIDLDVLSCEDATSLLEDLIGPERTHAEPEATAEVRDRCGRLPLALWIAGQLLAVHKSWPVSHLADMLGERQRLDRLAVGDRQVRSAFQTSYLQLADSDALMFRLLGLHQRSAINSSIAASLAGIDDRDAEVILERLVVAHLLVEVEADRYVMHDLIRLFSREICRAMTSGSGEALGLPTPLARLYATALQGDIDVSFYDDSNEPWCDDEIAAMASIDNIVILNPSLRGDLLTDVVAFAIAVCCALEVGDTAKEGYIAAPYGFVAIGRERLPEPPKGPGRLARMFAQECGREIDSVTFSVYTGPSEYDD